MPRMTPEQFEAYQAKTGGTGHPLKDALTSAPREDDEDAFRFSRAERGVRSAEFSDPDAMAAGQEIALHMEIMKECRRRGWVFVYHDPTRKTGATLGCPDFIIYAAAGTMLHVECKTKTGKLSKEQINFKEAVEVLGHEFRVIRSVQAFKRLAMADHYNGKGPC